MTQPVFVLVDCNNFFASCERLFRPDLRERPVAVLSNNDGCVIARTNEVKALGVPMAAPYYQWEKVLTANNVAIFSANFELYGDLSQRVTSVLRDFSPHLELYSVDESFLRIDDLVVEDFDAWARQVSHEVQSRTGIPVSVGVAPTKTLAKLAADRCKKTPELEGGLSLIDEATREQHLKALPLEDVWGVGRRTGPQLKRSGIMTAWDLSQVGEEWALQQLTVRGLKTVKELKGVSCIPLDDSPDPQQTILASRSFPHSVRAIHELEMAVATFAARAAAKARRQGEIAGQVVTFLGSGKHQTGDARHVAVPRQLVTPSSDTADIIKAALENLYAAYDPDFAYRRAGVVLLDLRPRGAQQLSMMSTSAPELERRDQLMGVVDQLNRRFGPHTIRHAAQGTVTKHAWHSKREHVSPAYTTRWDQLAKVRV